MSLNSQNNSQLLISLLGAVIAATPKTVHAYNSGLRKRRVKAVKLVNGAALAGDDTNNVKVELKAGATVIATYTNDVASGGLAQHVAKAMTLSTTEADLLLGKGVDLTIEATHNGTGQALDAEAKVEVEMHVQ